MLRYIFVTAILFTLLAPSSGLCQNLSGKVISVADGDTITILTQGNKQVKIRLYGIDTPEKGQEFGSRAKKFTASLVADESVRVELITTDRYGKTVAMVFLNDLNVNKEIVRSGFAWVYRKYCTEQICNEFYDDEEQARSAGLGLWHDAKPQPPWEWRNKDRSKVLDSVPDIAASHFHGNVKSNVFHAPGCQNYDCKNCVKTFGTEDKAIEAGYLPHKQCVN